MAALRDVQRKLRQIWPHLNERSRRMLAAAEAVQLGYGGVSVVSQACGLSRVTITKGIKELDQPALPQERLRRWGAGRKRLTVLDPQLPEVLEGLVEPLARGDPQSPLRWTCKSTRTLARELARRRHPISHEMVAQLLRGMDHSLQGNRKTEEGTEHPDRDAQFHHINDTIVRLIASTTTAKGLKVTCRLDRRKYTVGRAVTAQQMATINIKPEPFHGEWNYVIHPHQRTKL